MAMKPQVRELGAEVFLIDTAMSGYDGITAAYLIRGDRPCLVETGTATSAPVVRAALGGLGVGPDDLATIVVTHVHLDHAGGVGDLAAAYPRARIVVQDSGARHLADPSRLMASARRVFGTQMDELFGELLPTAAERIDAIGVVGAVDLGGGRRLEAHHTPGHARHHLGLVDSVTGDLYVGDASGLYIPPDDADLMTGIGGDGRSGAMVPATPPPDFDLDLAVASLRRMGDLGGTRLLFSHYGPITRVGESLERAAEEMRVWVDLVRNSRRQVDGGEGGAGGARGGSVGGAGEGGGEAGGGAGVGGAGAAVAFDVDHAVAMVREKTRERYADLIARPEVAAKFEALSSSSANVVGIARWLDTVDAAR
ncbi:MAG TPA: MBL fold metallo-hydrolase [Actinocrinis sp.]|jgi:glyoxylase-like metal-dependent hydrolase (beta-lactamase superfamily II)